MVIHSLRASHVAPRR